MTTPMPTCTACGLDLDPNPRFVKRGENGEVWHIECVPVNFRRCVACGIYFMELRSEYECAECYVSNLDELPDPPGWEGGFADNH